MCPVLKGALNNYVDQSLPNFDPPFPSSGQKIETLHIIYILSGDPHLPLLVHVVIKCPLTSIEEKIP